MNLVDHDWVYLRLLALRLKGQPRGAVQRPARFDTGPPQRGPQFPHMPPLASRSPQQALYPAGQSLRTTAGCTTIQALIARTIPDHD